MQEVGYWVLRKACHQAVDWQRMGLPSIRMAVNVSSQQFREGKIVEGVQSALQESGMEAKLLELELTESRVLDDSEAIIHILRSLKLIGLSLALDDFGTGWSSLSYLRRFPLDRLKIDRSFVRDIGLQRTADAVVKNILGLGKTLGIACIAEGVETRQQCEHLKRQGCPEMQGFYFSRPRGCTRSHRASPLREVRTTRRYQAILERRVARMLPSLFARRSPPSIPLKKRGGFNDSKQSSILQRILDHLSDG